MTPEQEAAELYTSFSVAELKGLMEALIADRQNASRPETVIFATARIELLHKELERRAAMKGGSR